MTQQGVSFRIKNLDTKSDLDDRKLSNSRAQDAPVSSITSWKQSQAPSEGLMEERRLVIPVQPDSYGVPEEAEKVDEEKVLEQEAIRAILMESSTQSVTQESVAIPLQPTSSRGSEESNREDYNEIPVSSFGKAALMGMGWKEGDSVGKRNKGLSEPIELIPHSVGLGLGAVTRKVQTKKRSKQSGPVVGTDGRVKHYKGLDEGVERASEAGTLRPGSYVRINEGAHEGLLAKVRELDADGKHVIVSLSLGESCVSFSLSDVVLLDPLTMRPVEDRKSQKSARKEINKTYGLILRGKQNERCTERNSSKGVAESVNRDLGSASASATTQFRGKQDRKIHSLKIKAIPHLSKRSWIRSNLKVRLISKKYKKGRYYNSKVSIVDVVSPGVCLCQSEQGQLLEEVCEEMLETLIPKDLTQPVMVVSGQYKGQVGHILQKHPSTCMATVLTEDLDNCLNLSYDDICQVNEVD